MGALAITQKIIIEDNEREGERTRKKQTTRERDRGRELCRNGERDKQRERVQIQKLKASSSYSLIFLFKPILQKSFTKRL